MNKKQKIKSLLKALGKGAREVYLKDNPNGYSAATKVWKNKKKYNRKNQKNLKHSED